MLIFGNLNSQLLSLFLDVFNLLIESVKLNRILLSTKILSNLIGKVIIKIFSDIKLLLDNF